MQFDGPQGFVHLLSRDEDPACLDASERDRAGAIADPRRRGQFVRGRTALRSLLSGILGVAPSEVPLEVGVSGAPSLRGGALSISLSHSGEGALAVASDRPVGCDLELPSRRRRDHLSIAGRFFDPLEADLLGRCPESSRDGLFLGMWTRKEAVFKSGCLDWGTCLSRAWRVGSNKSPCGTIRIEELHHQDVPTGWIACVALVDGSSARKV